MSRKMAFNYQTRNILVEGIYEKGEKIRGLILGFKNKRLNEKIVIFK